MGALAPERRTASDDWLSGSPAEPAGISVHVSRRGPRPVITVVGTLDLGGAALVSAMLDHVRRTEGRVVDLDLSRVDRADLQGLAALVDGRGIIREPGSGIPAPPVGSAR